MDGECIQQAICSSEKTRDIEVGAQAEAYDGSAGDRRREGARGRGQYACPIIRPL